MKTTIKDYTSITGYSTKTVREKLAKLFESASARPEPPDFIKAVIADLAETAAGRNKPSTEGKLDPNQERARKDKEHADKLQMENQVRRGELVEGEWVKQKWVQVGSNIRASLMSMPSRMALELSAIDTPRQIQIRMDEEVRSTLTILADDYSE